MIATKGLGILKANHALAGSLLSLSIKAAGAFMMVLIFILVARAVSPAAFGGLAMAFNILSFLSVVALFGQDTLFIRNWGEYFGRENGLAHGAFWFGWRVVTLGALLACLGLLAVGLLGPWRLAGPDIATGCFFLAALVGLQYSSNTCRHILNFVVSETNRELTWRLVLLAAALAAARLGLGARSFLLVAAGGMTLGIAIETLALARRFPAVAAAAPLELRTGEWLTRARSMWVSACIEAASQHAEVLLLGLLVSPAAAGGYFAAARLSNIFSMLTTGLHTYTVSYAANLYFNREIPRLQGILRSVMGVALSMTTPILVLVVLAGPQVLGLFGPRYASETATLLVLSGGMYVATMAGPSGGMLQLTGHEKLYARVVFVGLLCRVALVAWLAPRYGAFGAALGWAAVTVPMTVGLSAACRPLCGMDPSALSVFSRGPRLRPAAARA